MPNRQREHQEVSEGISPFDRLRGTLYWLLPMLATGWAYRQVGSFDLIGDARFLIRENTFLRHLDQLWANLTHDYFWSSSGASIPYWRPLTKAGWLVERWLFGAAPGAHHLVQLGWHLVAVGGVFALARTLRLSRWAAALSATIVGLHVAAIEPVCLVMARSDVVVLAGMLWAVFGWLHWREGSYRYLALHLSAALLALASKEIGVLIAPILLLFICCDADRRQRWRRELLSLVPLMLLTLGYLIARRWVLGHSPAPELDISLWMAGGAVYLQHLPPLRLESTLRSVPWAEARSLFFVGKAMLTWTCFAGVLLWSWRRSKRSLALAGWTLVVLVPVLLGAMVNVPAVEGKIPLADRWLYAALAPATLLLASLIDPLEHRLFKRVLAAAVLAWSVLSLLVSAPARAPYANEEHFVAIEARLQQLVPPMYRSKLDRCRIADFRVATQLVGKTSQRAASKTSAEAERLLRRCGSSPTRWFNLASALVRAGDYRRAWPALQSALKSNPEPRYLAQLHFFAGRTLLRLRRPRGASRHLAQAEKLGFQGCNLFLERAEAQLALQESRAGAASLERAARCHPKPAGLLLTAAYWWLKGGDVRRARRLVDRATSMHLAPKDRGRLEQLRSLLPKPSSRD